MNQFLLQAADFHLHAGGCWWGFPIRMEEPTVHHNGEEGKGIEREMYTTDGIERNRWILLLSF